MIKFQPADLVLVHSEGFSPLRLVTGMYYNHAAMIDEPILNDYGLIESIGKGPAPTLLSRYCGQEILVLRYKGITPDQQQAVRLAARGNGNATYDYLIVPRILLRVGVKQGVRLIVQLWNKEYPLHIPHIKDDHVVCSENFQEAFVTVGLLDGTWLLVPDAFVYPDICDKFEVVFRGVLGS